MVRAEFAAFRVVGRPDRGRDPHVAFGVHHGVVHVGFAVPDSLLPPVRRGLEHGAGGGGGGRVPDGEGYFTGHVVDGVQHGQVIGAYFQGAVEGAVCIHSGVPPVRAHQVMKVGLRVGPVPLRDDHVALYSLRSGRNRRHLARLDPVRPVRKHAQHPVPAHLVDGRNHAPAGLAGLETALPGLL